MSKAKQMSNKRFGYLAEQVFFTEAMRKNYDVLTPIGEYLPIDCVVMNRAGGTIKTQIKATDSKVMSNGAERYQICAGSGTSKTPIDCTKVDVVACYVNPYDQWYLIPCLCLEEKVKIYLYPQNPKSTGQYEKYKDNWEIFNTK